MNVLYFISICSNVKDRKCLIANNMNIVTKRNKSFTHIDRVKNKVDKREEKVGGQGRARGLREQREGGRGGRLEA